MTQIFRFPQNTTLDTGSVSFLLASSVTNSPHSAHCTPRTHVNPPPALTPFSKHTQTAAPEECRLHR